MRVFARASLLCGVAMAVPVLALLASGLFTSLAMASPGEDPSSSEQMTLSLKSIGWTTISPYMACKERNR
jgi:hypothetical protein